MEQNLKQRLVGAVVLISLAVIFLPLIFDRQQQRIDTSQYRIPEKPAMTIKAPDTGTLEQQVKTSYQPIAKIEQEKQNQDAASVAEGGATDDGDTQSTTDSPTPNTDTPTAKADTSSAVKKPPVNSSLATSAPPQEAVKQYLDKEKKADTGIHAKPATATVPLAESWIIQVGAFSSRTNADKLSKKLKAGGHAAFVKPMKISSRTLYKVYVGPEIRRYRLEKEKSVLEQKYKLKTLILQYIP